jgi:hypothetical protein
VPPAPGSASSAPSTPAGKSELLMIICFIERLVQVRV